MTVYDQNEPAVMYATALHTFQIHERRVVVRLLNFADTSRNNEVRIINALNETADAYRFHGFAEEVKAFSSELGLAVSDTTIIMEKNKGQEARDAALSFISLLRSLGFTTDDLNEVLGSVKVHNENAHTLGRAQAWIELTK